MEPGKGSEHVVVYGTGGTFKEAVENAWTKAKKREGQETTLEVLRISVHGKNPISSYSVILAPEGP